jgi:uncharacterized protein YecT (DUF1311 family)
LQQFKAQQFCPTLEHRNLSRLIVVQSIRSRTIGSKSDAQKTARALAKTLGTTMKNKIYIFVIGCFFMSGNLLAGEECEGDPSTTRFQACVSYRYFMERDKELKHLYEERLALYDKHSMAKERALFVAAQRAWIRFKKETCKFEQEAIGGAYSKSEQKCLARVTDERVEYLKQLDN